MELSPRNINPFTDFGFKKIFGEEATKDLLLDFINSILSEETGEITSLEYSKNEHLGLGELDRKVVFDIYCITDKGERIIVEMQKAFQLNFKDRSLFYTTFPVRDQAIVGDWDFELKAVYCISILDFKLKDQFSEPDKFIHRIGLLDRDTGERFSSKLNFIYLEVPKFGLSENQLGTKFEKWVYLFWSTSSDSRIDYRTKYFQKLWTLQKS